MQLADCCCNTQLAVANLAAQGDRNTCAITTAVHAEGEQTRALIQQNEMQALRDKVSALELNNAMCGVIRYPTATTFGAGMNPIFRRLRLWLLQHLIRPCWPRYFLGGANAPTRFLI